MGLLAQNSYSCVVRFSPHKTCFVYVPGSWLSNSADIHMFKLIYGKVKETYISCLPLTSSFHSAESYIHINAKFAEKLDLKENEKVCLQSIFSSFSTADKIVLEPLTSDDWEILELNSQYFESALLNQIRIVALNQIYPVWVNKAYLNVKVVEAQPPTMPLLLQEFSEVHIVPKDRIHQTKTTSEPRKKPFHLQFDHLRSNGSNVEYSHLSTESHCSDSYFSDGDNKSTAHRALSILSSFFSSPSEEKNYVPEDSCNANSEFVPLNLDFVLRVVPYTRLHVRPLPLVMQSTIVFISASTYISLFGAENVPPCFVAVLQKYVPFENKKERITNQQKINREIRESRQGDSLPRTAKEGKLGNTSNNDRQPTFDSVCVTVMVMNCVEEDEFNLPTSLFYTKNLIVVPKELKKCLSLDIGSLVHVRGVQIKPTVLTSVILHPLSKLPPDTSDEILHSNFEVWATKNKKMDVCHTISDGTYVSLQLFGQKCDFFVSLPDAPQFSNVSFSTSTSPNLSDTEKSKVEKKEPKYGYLSCKNIKKIQLKCGRFMCVSILVDRPYLQAPDGLYQDIPSLRLEALGGISKFIDEGLEDLEFWLKLRPVSYLSNHPVTFTGCILICGPKGVGKASLAKGLCKKLSKYPHHVFVRIISCLPLKGKRIDTIAKKWDDVVADAICSQPSVILFEGLDYIASCPASPEQEAGPDGMYFSNVVQTFIHILNKIKESCSRVAIIVTSLSTHSIHPNLINTKGRHIFQHILEIQPPDMKQREDILCSLIRTKPHLSNKTVVSVPWSKISSKTEGYVAQDLDSLIDRATHAAWVRMANHSKTAEIDLNVEDFEMALEGYIPSSLQGIPLQVQDVRTWNDVGGLTEVKKIVQQIIMWPVKYKDIFKSYSLKPQTNILLYGVPGTGKTLLAGVIANECGMNFISIKGPELLSKYIGASEQAVRDLFKRASAAKPCILFFDEFDSIAPRRGHDSTGVTDRVVNQLLTQLDGVESIEGVHVLAASSRPELIDPALLRPGRLDKCLLCPLPDEAERLEILQCLSSKLSLSSDVDMKKIAELTDFFSGADLQALLYTANIKALNSSLTDSSKRYSTSSDDLTYSAASDKLLYMSSVEDGLSVPSYEEGKKIIQEVSVIKENFSGVREQKISSRRSSISIAITNKHLVQVAREMQPSVIPQERLRYEKVFQNFCNALSGEPTSSVAETIKRVTLA